MDCKEFKKTINSDNSNDLEILDKHLENCKSCSSWLDSHLETKPNELGNPILESPTLRCKPEIPQEIDETKKEGLLSMYLSGLKYGLTFGISVAIAISIFGPTKTVHQVNQINEMVSFVSKDNAIPSFVNINSENENNEKKFVTSFTIKDSKLVSFVDDEIITSFDEENLEELAWLENQSG